MFCDCQIADAPSWLCFGTCRNQRYDDSCLTLVLITIGVCMPCTGIGKSTALKVLAGKLKPNLGRYEVSQCLAEMFIRCCLAQFVFDAHV